MIKFFRKIRQNLLSEGKTGKYLKYAIGSSSAPQNVVIRNKSSNRKADPRYSDALPGGSRWSFLYPAESIHVHRQTAGRPSVQWGFALVFLFDLVQIDPLFSVFYECDIPAHYRPTSKSPSHPISMSPIPTIISSIFCYCSIFFMENV